MKESKYIRSYDDLPETRLQVDIVVPLSEAIDKRLKELNDGRKAKGLKTIKKKGFIMVALRNYDARMRELFEAEIDKHNQENQL